MPCRPRWSAETLVTTETSLRVRPMPLSRMPPRAVSVTANSTSSWASTRPAPLGPGVVARLDQLAVDVDAVGVRPADEPCRRCGRCGRSSGDVVVLPLVPVTATTGTRGVIVCGAVAGVGARPPARRPRSTASSTSAPGQRVEHLGDGPAHRLGPLPVPPRERDHDLVRVARRPHAYGEPRRTRLRRRSPGPAAPPRGRRTAAGSPYSGCARPGVRQPDPASRTAAAVSVGRRRPARRCPGSA